MTKAPAQIQTASSPLKKAIAAAKPVFSLLTTKSAPTPRRDLINTIAQSISMMQNSYRGAHVSVSSGKHGAGALSGLRPAPLRLL